MAEFHILRVVGENIFFGEMEIKNQFEETEAIFNWGLKNCNQNFSILFKLLLDFKRWKSTQSFFQGRFHPFKSNDVWLEVYIY